METPNSFNLDPPPNFQGLDDHRPLSVYQRNLPHWRQEGATYFVTFHLADALPAGKRRELESFRRDWIRTNPTMSNQHLEQFAREQFRRIEQLIDAGHGACWFRNSTYIDEMRRAILHFHDQRYEVGAFVIMANHCHLTIRPFEKSDLEELMGAMKSVVSHFVNRREGLQGSMWYQESYDRIVRDAEHLYRVVQYIGSNPRRAGIELVEGQRWINPNWQACGWDFLDK